MGKATQPKGFKQIIYSEPLWLKTDPILTKKGKRLMQEKSYGEAEIHEIYKKYLRGRWVKNPNAKVVKVIYHPKLDKFGKLLSYHG